MNAGGKVHVTQRTLKTGSPPRAVARKSLS